MIKRLLIGLVVGCAITAVPTLVMRIWDGFHAINILLLPGIAVTMPLGGNVHDFSVTVLIVANIGIYAAITYLFLYLWDRGKEPKPQAPVR